MDLRLSFQPMDEAHARIALHWRYEPPYDLYNTEPAQIESAIPALLAPENQYHIIFHDDEMIGYACFGPDAQVRGGNYAEPALDVGIGLRPDWTGRGHGATIILALLDFARAQFMRAHPPHAHCPRAHCPPANFAPPQFRATIAAINTRSRKAFERAGFQHTDTFRRPSDGLLFDMLTRKP